MAAIFQIIINLTLFWWVDCDSIQRPIQHKVFFAVKFTLIYLVKIEKNRGGNEGKEIDLLKFFIKINIYKYEKEYIQKMRIYIREYI